MSQTQGFAGDPRDSIKKAVFLSWNPALFMGQLPHFDGNNKETNK